MSAASLNNTTGLIYKNDAFVGSSVLFPWQNELLCLTAGHNMYGRNFDRGPNLREWKVIDHQGISHPVTQLIGDCEFASKHDIMLLKLDCQSTLNEFFCPKFCTIPQNPSHSLLFRGKYEASKTIVTHRKLYFNSLCIGFGHQFLCAFERALLTNNTYSSGSDWLQGWSGSGLFIDNHKELICAGIMIEIPNKGDDGQLQFTSVSALAQLGINLELMPSTELDFDKTLSKTSLTAIFETVDEQAISDWENNGLHKPQLEFINDKLPKVYPENNLSVNKRRIIKQLLLGKSYLMTELKKNEQLFSQYKNAYNVYNLEDKQVYVNNRPEALAALTKIKEDYEKYLSNSIGDEFSVSDVKLLAFYGVSKWISDCSLSFLADEQ
jgi:hypothetical protein